LPILRSLLLIPFSIKDGYDSVLCATNDESGRLLHDKFGFEVKEEDDMDYLNSYFLPELYLSNGILINALESYVKLFDCRYNLYMLVVYYSDL
jgi:hypothetical protein